MPAKKPAPPPPAPNARAVASSVVGRVLREDAYIQPALSSALDRARTLTAQDKGFATELSYGTLRHLALVDAAIEKAAERRLKKIDDVLLDAARVAAYEALFLHSPDHALVNEAVNHARRLRGDGAAKFLNGVLRGLLRLRDSGVLLSSSEKSVDGLVARTGLPNWLAADVTRRLGPEGAEAFGAASLARPRTHLCVPSGNPTRDALLAELATRGIESEAHPLTDTGILLRTASAAIDALLLGDDQRAMVQNVSSQLVALWAVSAALEKGPGGWVIDLCAAPGGKSAVMASRGLHVISGDVHVDKLHQAQDQWHRLQVQPLGVALDGRMAPFRDACVDTVLLDAPCTGTGLLARRPEIKFRRGEAKLAELVELQRLLLESAARLVKPGGSLLYSVCSVSSAEGPEQARAFLKVHPEFQVVPCPLHLSPDATDQGMLTLWPHLHDADGFFAVRLKKSN